MAVMLEDVWVDVRVAPRDDGMVGQMDAALVDGKAVMTVVQRAGAWAVWSVEHLAAAWVVL